MSDIRDDLIEIIGYSAETCVPDGKPVTAFYTDRHLRPILDRLVEYVEAQRADEFEKTSADIISRSRQSRTQLQEQVQEWWTYAELNQRGGYMRDEHRVGQAYAYDRVLDLLTGEGA